MDTEEVRKRVYPDLPVGLRDLVMMELEWRDARIKLLETQAGQSVHPNDLVEFLNEYASDCQVSQRVRIDPCSWLQEKGYLPGEAVKPCREEMEAQVGPIRDIGNPHERLDLAQVVKAMVGMKD